MKIIVVSDAVWHVTGYGVSTKLLCERLVRDGHRVYNYAPGAFSQGQVDVDGVTVLSSGIPDDRWGNVTLATHVRNINPDLIITWLDVHGMGNYGLDGTPLYIWAPIDTWPVPEPEKEILARANKILVPSRWGQAVLKDAGLESEYVPCGIDVEAFRPDPDGRKEWREQWGFGDEFVVGMVGLNGGSPDRKGYGYAFDIIKAFSEKHPEARFYIHTNPEGSDGAINLYTLRETLGLEEVVIFPENPGPAGWPTRYMRHVYNGIDVLLHTSLTEGIGLPVIEAQACGTPVVVNSATTVTEFSHNGHQVPPLAPMWINTATRVAIPDSAGMLEALEDFHERRHRVAPSRLVEWAQQFAFDVTYEAYWRPLIESVPAPIRIAERKRKLVLGAGMDIIPGATHHDREKFAPHIDVAWDLNVTPWPWADGSWDYIEMSDVIEHLTVDVTEVMDELHRILAPDGMLFLHTVKAGSWQHHHDPTHTRAFEMTSFDYYDPETQWGRTYKYSERAWKVLRRTVEPKGGILVLMMPRKDEQVLSAEQMEAVAG